MNSRLPESASWPVASPSISLVLPAWNEAAAITTAIEEADAALRGICQDYEIIVVDDGSLDQTAELVSRAAERNPAVRLIRHGHNRGYGAALRSGFDAARKDRVVFTDADCQFDLTELDRFLLLSQDYEIVCGYRIDRKDSWSRCFYSRVYNHLAGLMLGTNVRDVDCALKMFRRSAIDQLTITTDGFTVNSELLTRAAQKQMSIVEVGVTHRPRTAGTSKVSVAHIPCVLASLIRFWWNTVQFPAEAPTRSGSAAAERAAAEDSWLGWAQCMLLLIAAAFLFTNLSYPLIDRDETRYAEIAREMVTTNNWILPRLNFEPYYDKPPLLYWLCATSYRLFGTTAWSARLIPAIAALVTLGATMCFGSRVFGRRVGTLAATALMLSVGFVFTSRYLLIDGLLTMFVTLSLYAAYEALRGSRVRMRWWLASAVCCGLAFLSKGPIAIVLLWPPVLAFAWLSAVHARPRWWHYALQAAVVIGIAAPWLVAVSIEDPRFLVEFFYTHNLRRFAGEYHARAWWYFIPVLLVAGHPWSFLTFSFTQFMFSRTSAARQGRLPALGFLLLWSGWCFLFFSLSKCKLPTYLLPAAPAFALMIGHYLHHALNATPRESSRWLDQRSLAQAAAATTCVAGIGFVAYGLFAGLEISLVTYAWGLLWCGLLIAVLLVSRDRLGARGVWASCSATTFLLAVMVMHQMLPAYGREQTVFGPSSPVALEISPRDHPPVATIAHEFSEVPFYLDRSDVRNFEHSETEPLRDFLAKSRRAVLVLAKRIPLAEFRSQLPAGTKLRIVAERGPARVLMATSPERPNSLSIARSAAAGR